MQKLGGRIFYIKEDANLDNYHFYDKSGIELLDKTVFGLIPAVYYKLDTPSNIDNIFVFTLDNLSQNQEWGFYETTIGNISSDIGCGRQNSLNALNKLDSCHDYYGKENTIWHWLKNLNDTNFNEHNDWYIGTDHELELLHSIKHKDFLDVLKLFKNEVIWTSTEANLKHLGQLNPHLDVRCWVRWEGSWYNYPKLSDMFIAFPIRSF